MVDWLPHINATLNGIATLLLILGFVTIKKRMSHYTKRQCGAVSRWLACF